MRIVALFLVMALSACSSTYYNTLEQFGVHKREILVDRVDAARDSQVEAKEQFETALEKFRSVVDFDGGDLEKTYNELNRELESGYGIFSGASTRRAALRFSPQLARWVSRETWHPDQTSDYDAEGFYILRVPYSQDTELVMDILKHGPEVEVLEPPQLRERVRQRIDAMQDLYAEN